MAIFEAIDDILLKVSNFNEYSKAIVTLASAIGFAVLIYYSIIFFYRLIQVVRLYVCSQLGCCQINFVERYGKWAVVTGATDGIGLCMARELARRGMSIIVLGRNEEKLARTKTELEQEPNVGEVETVKADLSDSSLENFDRIKQQIDPDNRDIGMLVNNAGTFPGEFLRFNRFDMEFLLNISNLNMIAPMQMTRIIMPGMIARGKGMILNVSSMLGSMAGPYLSVYSPTKAFLDSFTQQLQIEYSSHPIDIFLLTTGAVHTRLFTTTANVSRPSIFNPTPEDYAKSALNAVSSRINTYSGTLAHGFTLAAGRLFQSLGVSQTLYRINLAMNARSLDLSPVPKRRAVQPTQTSQHLAKEDAPARRD